MTSDRLGYCGCGEKLTRHEEPSDGEVRMTWWCDRCEGLREIACHDMADLVVEWLDERDPSLNIDTGRICSWLDEIWDAWTEESEIGPGKPRRTVEALAKEWLNGDYTRPFHGRGGRS